jgi:hypothetical protein
MADPDFEPMTPDEASDFARNSFLAAERYAQSAVEMTRADGGPLHEIAQALDSIAYGFKITTPRTPTA